jgi:hypothetical protein
MMIYILFGSISVVGDIGPSLSFYLICDICHGDPKTKAKLLNSQFSSVFSTDNTSNIPNLGTSQYNEAPQITVTQNGVYKLLHGLNQHKATGPDEISQDILIFKKLHEMTMNDVLYDLTTYEVNETGR